jgi:hypothetical protein
MKDWGEKSIRPSDSIIRQAIDAARTTNNTGLLDRIATDMERIDFVQRQGRDPLASQQAVLGAVSAAASAGDLHPGQAPLLRDMQSRFDAVRKGLENDPVQTTVSNFPERFKPLPAINPADSADFRAGLAARAKIIAFAGQNWKIGNLHVLDRADLLTVHAVISAADPATKARIFSDITAALPEQLRNATFAKLGEKGPAAMIDAFAGALYSQDQNASIAIINGWRALDADKRFDPQKENAANFNEAFDKALPASAFGLGARTSDKGALATIKNAVRAFYAYRSAQLGDTSGALSTDRLEEAISAVTGGVLTHNGGALIAPARGMPQRQFDAILANMRNADLAGVTTLSGQSVTADYVRNRAQLESVGDGRYLIRLGQNAGQPIYAFTQVRMDAHDLGTPKPFILDFRSLPIAPEQKPDSSDQQPFAAP